MVDPGYAGIRRPVSQPANRTRKATRDLSFYLVLSFTDQLATTVLPCAAPDELRMRLR